MISDKDTPVGCRVWCVRNATGTHVYAHGFGTYEGDFPRPGWDDPDELARAQRAILRNDGEGEEDKALKSVIGLFEHQASRGEITRTQADENIERARQRRKDERARPMPERIIDLARRLGSNPRIKLDSGQTVWGCQCYWGAADEEDALRWANGRTIVQVPVTELTG